MEHGSHEELPTADGLYATLWASKSARWTRYSKGSSNVPRETEPVRSYRFCAPCRCLLRRTLRARLVVEYAPPLARPPLDGHAGISESVRPVRDDCRSPLILLRPRTDAIEEAPTAPQLPTITDGHSSASCSRPHINIVSQHAAFGRIGSIYTLIAKKIYPSV